MADLTLEVENGYFSYRVGAIIIHENKILMVKNDNYPYYYSVGGRVHFNETSEEAILREVYEETQIHFEIDRLAFLHENFFVGEFLGSKPVHEISLFFLLKPNRKIDSLRCDSVSSEGVKETLHWLAIDELPNYPIFPEFFKTELKQIEGKVGHFITRGENTFCSN